MRRSNKPYLTCPLGNLLASTSIQQVSTKSIGALWEVTCAILSGIYGTTPRRSRISTTPIFSLFRPIVLCNTIYEVLSKVVVNRLKVVIDHVLSPFQMRLIPKRSIHDNIVVANEFIHKMHRFKGKKLFCYKA